GPRIGTYLACKDFVVRATDHFENASSEHSRGRRTSWNVAVDRKYVMNGSGDGVARGKNPSTATTGTHRNYQLGGSCRLKRLAHRLGHVACNRAGDEQHVSMLGRSDKVDAKTLQVIAWIGEGRDLGFAPVARSGIELADV